MESWESHSRSGLSNSLENLTISHLSTSVEVGSDRMNTKRVLASALMSSLIGWASGPGPAEESSG